MTDAHAGLVLGLTQAALTIAIVADRWVHRMTGTKSHETRIAELEQRIETLHRKASDFHSDQQVKVGDVALRLERIEEHLRNTDKNVERLERRRNER